MANPFWVLYFRGNHDMFAITIVFGVYLILWTTNF